MLLVMTGSASLFLINVVMSDSFHCAPFKCLAAISLFEPEFTVSVSTPASVPFDAIEFPIITETIRLVSIYALLMGVLLLIVLELQELRYLKYLTHKERLRRRS